MFVAMFCTSVEFNHILQIKVYNSYLMVFLFIYFLNTVWDVVAQYHFNQICILTNS